MRLGQFSHAEAAFAQRFEHRAARGVGERCEDGVERGCVGWGFRRWVNHAVEYLDGG
jgi:hypothetical protein